ncbi:MAG: hypothetical protein ABSB75_06675 [Candidatus Limnocylindrales bacterium]
MLRLSEPKIVTFIVALVLAIVALVVGKITTVDTLTTNALWIALAAWLVLALGNVLKGV